MLQQKDVKASTSSAGSAQQRSSTKTKAAPSTSTASSSRSRATSNRAQVVQAFLFSSDACGDLYATSIGKQPAQTQSDSSSSVDVSNTFGSTVPQAWPLLLPICCASEQRTAVSASAASALKDLYSDSVTLIMTQIPEAAAAKYCTTSKVLTDSITCLCVSHPSAFSKPAFSKSVY